MARLEFMSQGQIVFVSGHPRKILILEPEVQGMRYPGEHTA